MNRWGCETPSNCSTSSCGTLDGSAKFSWNGGPSRVRVPFVQGPEGGSTVCKSRAVWECSTTARCISGKAKYCSDTDSGQVVRTKDQKHSAKRVKQPLKPLRGKARGSIGWARVADWLWFGMHLPLPMPARVTMAYRHEMCFASSGVETLVI